MAAIPTMKEIEEQQQKEALAQQREEQKQSILDQIMEIDARERLQRLKLVKPEKASAVEESLIKAATNQQLKAKVTDKQLQEMLAGVSDDSSVNKKKIIVQRKKYADDSESDNDDDLL